MLLLILLLCFLNVVSRGRHPSSGLVEVIKVLAVIYLVMDLAATLVAYLLALKVLDGVK